MNELYMIVLEGGGDIEVKIVDKETIDWLDSECPEMEEYSAIDKSVPDAVRQRAWNSLDKKYRNKPYENYFPDVTSGSCENDRALWVAPLTIEGEMLQFDDVAEATNWFVKHGIKCAGSWKGYIY